MKVITAVIVMMLAQNSFAKFDDGLVDSVMQAEKIFNKVHTAGEFLSSAESELPKDVVEFLNSKVKSSNLKEVPKVKVVGSTSLQFDFRKHSLLITYLPDYKIRINAKTLNLLEAQSLEEQWKMIISALPDYQKTSMLELFISEAKAEDNAERLTGGVMMGTGAMSAVGGAGSAIVADSAVATTAALSVTGAGVVVMGASYLIWNNGTCIGMGKEKFSCLKTKDEADEVLNKHPNEVQALHSHQHPICAEHDSQLKNQLYERLSDLVNNNNEMFRKIVTCRKTKAELNTCISDLSVDAHYLCVKTHGLTDRYLPAFAREAASPGDLRPPSRAKK